MPRPLPKHRLEVEGEEQGETQEVWHDACDASGMSENALSEALMASTTPVVQLLRDMGEAEAAGTIETLCDQLDERERALHQLEKRHGKVKEKLAEAQEKVASSGNFRAQSTRWWWKGQRLQRQLQHERQARQWHERKPRHPP